MTGRHPCGARCVRPATGRLQPDQELRRLYGRVGQPRRYPAHALNRPPSGPVILSEAKNPPWRKGSFLRSSRQTRAFEPNGYWQSPVIAINKFPNVNKREIWKLIQDECTANLLTAFPDQREPGQSYRRASGDAWEMFVEEYLNSNDTLRKEGIRAVRLSGQDFRRLMAGLDANELEHKDVDFFLSRSERSRRSSSVWSIVPESKLRRAHKGR